MRVIEGLDNRQLEPARRVVTAGAFDGVHRGHQMVLKAAGQVASEYEAECTVLTFEPAPVEVFSPRDSYNIRLTTEQERQRELDKLGVETLVVARFDEAFQQISAGDFAEQYLHGWLGAIAVVVSENHTWGRGGEGNVDLLRRLGEQWGFAVRVVPLSTCEKEPISSSQIRRLLWAGEVSRAAQLLGRPYSLSGTVAPGSGRGRQLGFPTANLIIPAAKLVPAPGVYTALVEAEGVPRPTTTAKEAGWPAAVSVGASPTFAQCGDKRLVEAHLLGFDGDLANATITVQLVDRLRDQRVFNTEIALKTQIAADVEELRLRLESSDGMIALVD